MDKWIKGRRSKLISCLLVATCSANAQQTNWSNQYMTNPTPYNIAYATLERDGGSLHLLGRRQWVGINGAPSSVLINANLALPTFSANTGLTILYDEIGAERLTEASAFFAKAVQLDENLQLAASLKVGIRHYTAHYSQLDPFDVKFREDLVQTSPTMGLGVMLFQPNHFYVGASLPRLNIRELGDASTDRAHHFRHTWHLIGAYLFEVDRDITLKPVSLISYTKTLPVSLDFSLSSYFKQQFGVGAGYRSSGDIVGLLDYLSPVGFRVGYTYQTAVGNNRNTLLRGVTHEISLGYYFLSGLRGISLL